MPDDTKPCIGVKLPFCRTTEQLDAGLGHLKEAGFDEVEFDLGMFPLIIGGNICMPWAECFAKTLRRFPFEYSAHIGRGLDLRSGSDIDLQWAVLKSSIKLCAMFGANPLVLHYEVRSRDERTERQFFAYHRKASEFAASLGVTLCIENIEVECISPVIAMVSRMDMPNFRMTLDTGHAYLASRYFHFDYLEAVSEAAPYVGHVHVNDNTGTFEELRISDRTAYDALPMGYRRTFGRGDIHVPPYFGTVPLDDVFRLLKDYRGKFVCEYTTESFLPFDGQIRDTVFRAVSRARSEVS